MVEVDRILDDRTIELVLVNGTRYNYIAAPDAGLPYFTKLSNDIRDRTATAMPQAHVYQVCETTSAGQILQGRHKLLMLDDEIRNWR